MPQAKTIVFGCQVRSTPVRDICYKLNVAVPLVLWVKQLTSCYYLFSGPARLMSCLPRPGGRTHDRTHNSESRGSFSLQTIVLPYPMKLQYGR